MSTEPDQASVEVPRITVENLDDEPHIVQVVLRTADGATIFSRRAEIEPAEYDNGEWDQPMYVRWDDVTTSVD